MYLTHKSCFEFDWSRENQIMCANMECEIESTIVLITTWSIIRYDNTRLDEIIKKRGWG